MNTLWSFTTDAASSAFCWEIVAELQRLFGVSHEEALGRINDHWRGQDILGDDIVYHELPEYWAHVLYYGKSSAWWIAGAKRAAMNLGPLVPKPYSRSEQALPDTPNGSRH